MRLPKSITQAMLVRIDACWTERRAFQMIWPNQKRVPVTYENVLKALNDCLSPGSLVWLAYKFFPRYRRIRLTNAHAKTLNRYDHEYMSIDRRRNKSHPKVTGEAYKRYCREEEKALEKRNRSLARSFMTHWRNAAGEEK